MKKCEDCKYHKPEEEVAMLGDDLAANEFAKCICPKNTGKYCILSRMDGWFESWMFKSCGKRGRWFEPK